MGSGWGGRRGGAGWWGSEENGAMVESVVAAGAPVGELVAGALSKGARRLRRAIAMVEKGEDDAIHQVRVSS